MRQRVLRTSLMLVAAAAVASCARARGDYRTSPPDSELLHTAVDNLTQVIVYDIFSPPQAARAYSYASIAAYEALRHSDSTYGSLAGQANGLGAVPVPAADSEYYFPLAGVQAFMRVGRALTFSHKRMDSLRAVMHDRIRDLGLPEAVFERSVAYGDKVAQHILAWSTQDNFLQTRGYAKYAVTNEPGRWVPTPPGYMDAVEPHWARVRPFVLDSASQFRPKAPHPFDTRPGSPFFLQVKEVHDAGRNLTDEQRAIAAFWDCNPYVMNVRGHAMYATKKVSPGGHWMGITAIASRKSGASLVQTAEAYARVAMALHDGFISAWEEKFRSNVVRPETMINAHLDEAWEPLLQTPPFPEYTSGHSVISTAAAAVLTDQFGDNFAFADSTEMAYGLPIRSFPSFNAAAAEAAISRLYGGIHYRMAIEEGITQGRGVGQLVVQKIHTRAPLVRAPLIAGSKD